MKKLVIVCLLLSSGVFYAQEKPDDVTVLKAEIASLKAQASANERTQSLRRARETVKDLRSQIDRTRLAYMDEIRSLQSKMEAEIKAMEDKSADQMKAFSALVQDAQKLCTTDQTLDPDDLVCKAKPAPQQAKK